VRFIVDEQLPPRLVEWLRRQGQDAHHVRDLGFKSASDRVIRDHAGDSVIVTKDEDFARIQRNGDGAILWLRCGNLRRSDLLARFAQAWPGVLVRLDAGERCVEITLASKT
jgi:predicted nuclease of predicted toxin-antitoxin system